MSTQIATEPTTSTVGLAGVTVETRRDFRFTVTLLRCKKKITFIFHWRPHFDELLAAWFIWRFADDEWVAAHALGGTVMLGLGFGEFDEHAGAWTIDESGGIQFQPTGRDCTASLVADSIFITRRRPGASEEAAQSHQTIKLSQHPEVKRMLRYAVHGDTTGDGRGEEFALEIAHAIKARYCYPAEVRKPKKRGEKQRRNQPDERIRMETDTEEHLRQVLRWTWQGIDARWKNRSWMPNVFTIDHLASLMDRRFHDEKMALMAKRWPFKSPLAWHTFGKFGILENQADHQRAYGAFANEAEVKEIERAGDSAARKLRVAFWQTANPQASSAARRRHMDVVVQQYAANTVLAGGYFVSCRTDCGFDLNRLAFLLRVAEQKANPPAKEVDEVRFLASCGPGYVGSRWYLYGGSGTEGGVFLFNRALTNPGTAPTALPHNTIRQAVSFVAANPDFEMDPGLVG